MDKLSSRDGTSIACWRSGSGPPLVLIHGAMSDHTRWTQVGADFERHFTVYSFDRRGRGESGDGPEYSFGRECEDAVAVIEHIDGPVTVLGHSYGADIALEAALMTDRIERLVLYEPGVLEGATGFYTTGDVAEAIRIAERHLETGQRDAAMQTILSKVIGIPDEQVDELRAMPTWPTRVATAHTVLRELRAEGDWRFDLRRCQRLTMPTLLLTGSESLEIARRGTEALHDALPNAAVTVFEGEGHVAMITAPDLFVRAVLDFLLDS